ncbi:MAG TPA: fibronectin type III domain-containing protein [Candidatus Aquilonibacter sp.]|nr:fibronectin type III domain-containing protein [Candidatus Aquilonibacter sp.]
MSNQIPKIYDPLVQLLQDAADGANQHGDAVGLKQNPEAAIRTDLEALIGTPAGPNNNPPAEPGLKSLWDTAKAKKTTMTAALRTAESNGRALALTCIGTLRPVLGQKWNSAWNAAGFTTSSLAVPAHPQGMLLKLRAYYDANPGREVKEVNGIDCTGAACQADADAIGAAVKASNESNTDAGTAQKNLQNGIDAARARGSGLLAELTQLLDDNDPRWLAFGFELPGHPGSPDVPQNLTVTPGATGSHTLFAHCSDARRAEGYRFTVSNAADNAQLAQDLTQDAEDTLNQLPSGAQVKVTVSARNATGESQPSAAVTVTVP